MKLYDAGRTWFSQGELEKHRAATEAAFAQAIKESVWFMRQHGGDEFADQLERIHKDREQTKKRENQSEN